MNWKLDGRRLLGMNSDIMGYIGRTENTMETTV